MQVRSLGLEYPLEKEMATTTVFSSRKFNRQRSLGYSPWWWWLWGEEGWYHKESDKIEHFLLQNLLYSIGNSTQYSVIT